MACSETALMGQAISASPPPPAILWLGALVPQLAPSHEEVGGRGHRLAQDGEELACRRVDRVGGELKRVHW